MVDYTPSPRARRVWDRLREWYPDRFIKLNGPRCTADWGRLIDKAENDVVKLALAELRRESPAHPPTFPMFERVMLRASRPKVARASVIEKIADWVVRNRGAHALPLTYLGNTYDSPDASGKMAIKHGVNFTGVVIPAMGNKPAERIMLVDMGLEAFRELPPPIDDYRSSASASDDAPNFGEVLKPMPDDGPSPSDIARGPWKSDPLRS